MPIALFFAILFRTKRIRNKIIPFSRLSAIKERNFFFFLFRLFLPAYNVYYFDVFSYDIIIFRTQGKRAAIDFFFL